VTGTGPHIGTSLRGKKKKVWDRNGLARSPLDENNYVGRGGVEKNKGGRAEKVTKGTIEVLAFLRGGGGKNGERVQVQKKKEKVRNRKSIPGTSGGHLKDQY